jgi:hypothetical protein
MQDLVLPRAVRGSASPPLAAPEEPGRNAGLFARGGSGGTRQSYGGLSRNGIAAKDLSDVTFHESGAPALASRQRAWATRADECQGQGLGQRRWVITQVAALGPIADTPASPLRTF